MHLGAEPGGDLTAAVLGRRVHHQELVDQTSQALEALDDQPDRVRHLAAGEHHRHGLPLALEQDLRAGTGRGGRSGSPERLLSQAVARVLPSYPWEPVLDAGRDEELVASSREREQAGLAEPIPDDLHPALLKGLADSGVETLWAHQADALEAARRGHAIVTTGTASGKSLAFNLPVLDTLAGDPAARAFYLYPTKALAQDQARALARLGGRWLRHAIYDGDTPREERRAIRGRSSLILTNPDMLHVGVLPNHAGWGDVLANLAWVVVDEAHVYRGVFGSHVANVLRRLRRLARAYGSEPRFLLTSATIANPVELAERLTGSKSGSWTATARRAPSAGSRCGTRRLWTSASAGEPPRSRRRPTCWPTWWSARCARSASSSRAAEWS